MDESANFDAGGEESASFEDVVEDGPSFESASFGAADDDGDSFESESFGDVNVMLMSSFESESFESFESVGEKSFESGSFDVDGVDLAVGTDFFGGGATPDVCVWATSLGDISSFAGAAGAFGAGGFSANLTEVCFFEISASVSYSSTCSASVCVLTLPFVVRVVMLSGVRFSPLVPGEVVLPPVVRLSPVMVVACVCVVDE